MRRALSVDFGCSCQARLYSGLFCGLGCVVSTGVILFLVLRFRFRAALPTTVSTGCCGGLDVYVSNQICRSRGQFWAVSVVGGAGMFLTFRRSMGGLWASRLSLSKHVFIKRTTGKTFKKCSTSSNNRKCRPTRQIIRCGLFEKVCKTYILTPFSSVKRVL